MLSAESRTIPRISKRKFRTKIVFGGKMRTNKEIIQSDDKIIPSANRVPSIPLALSKGDNSIVIDVEGREYIDLFGSAAVVNVGHGNRKVIESIKKQAEKLIHYTPANSYSSSVVRLAQELTKVTPGSFKKRVSLGLSGSDAIDSAIKFARGFTGRSKIVSFINGYHGSTYGALTLSGLSVNMKRKIGPLVSEIYHVPYPDCYRCPLGRDYEGCNLDCLEYLENMLFDTIIPPEEVAAIFVEPIQGDAGMVVPPDEFHPKLKNICEENKILFIDDEVQMGFGRTGKWFAINHWDIVPDLTVLGKPIASGMPLSAVVGRNQIMESLKAPADIFSCQGNPVCCEASLATLEEIKAKNLVEKSLSNGKYMKNRLLTLKSKHPLIGDIRGKGLSIGIDLVTDKNTKKRATNYANKVCGKCLEKGVIMGIFQASVLRIQPPLTISREKIDKAVEIIDDSLEEIKKPD